MLQNKRNPLPVSYFGCLNHLYESRFDIQGSTATIKNAEFDQSGTSKCCMMSVQTIMLF